MCFTKALQNLLLNLFPWSGNEIASNSLWGHVKTQKIAPQSFCTLFGFSLSLFKYSLRAWFFFNFPNKEDRFVTFKTIGNLENLNLTAEEAQYRLRGKLDCLHSNKTSFQLTLGRLLTYFGGWSSSPATNELHVSSVM